jgi:hypothetical protein
MRTSIVILCMIIVFKHAQLMWDMEKPTFFELFSDSVVQFLLIDVEQFAILRKMIDGQCEL